MYCIQSIKIYNLIGESDSLNLENLAYLKYDFIVWSKTLVREKTGVSEG